MDQPVRPPRSGADLDVGATAMVFTRDRDSEGVIRQCLSDLSVANSEFVNGNVDTAVAQLAQRRSPRLLVVDMSGSADPVAEINGLAEVCEPGTGVIAIGDSNDISLYRDLKQAGIVEYYFKPLVGTLIARTANAILAGGLEELTARTGKLVFVLGVRGDVGATTITVGMASYLSEKRQRRVFLLDLDLHRGDAALQLDVMPTHALSEALEHPERVDDLFLERGIIHVTDRLSLLASIQSLSDVTVPEEVAVLSLLTKLMHRYRYVFVDMPPELAPRMLKALHLPSICLLVSNRTLVSARDVARFRELIGPNSAERQTLHIVNKNGANGGFPELEFVRAAGQAPDLKIPYDRTIAAASIVGFKAVLACSTLRKGIVSILRHVAGEKPEQERSLVARIFGRS